VYPAVDPRLLADLYRSLRKGREDNNNEPGAADFYYGEMEMRRLSAPRLSMDRAVLRLYQVLAGYGLRAAVPLLLIVMLLMGAAAFMLTQGYADPRARPPSLWASLVTTTESVLSILRGNEPSGLRLRGQAAIVTLRILIPVLVALAFLAIRGRVKRR
jgi:hypothetical protein